MQTEHRLEPKWLKPLLLGITLLFLGVFLALPLGVVFSEALAKGWKVYFESISEPDALAAIKLTLLLLP